MERNLDIDDFERMLKERSDEFKLYPTKRVWHSIYNNIHPGKKWPSIAMCITLISILMLVGYLNTSYIETTVATAGIKANQANAITTYTYYPLFKPSLPNKNIDDNNFTLNNNSNPFGYSASINTNPTTAFYLNKPVSNNKNFSDYIDNKLVGASTPLNINSVAFNNQFNTAKNTLPARGPNAVQIDNYPSNLIAERNASDKSFSDAQTKLIGKEQKNETVTLPSLPSIENTNSVSIDASAEQHKIVAIIPTDDNANIVIVNRNVENLKAGIDYVKSKAVSSNATLLAIAKKDAADKREIFLSDADKAWIENYALYNKPGAKKWAGKLGWQLYVTPSIVYRSLKDVLPSDQDINKEVVQHPSMGVEIGAGILYPIFKGVKIKTGLQLNYTRYNTDAYENSHPVATNITLSNSEMPGQFYQAARTTPYSNYGGITPVKLHNETYQLSIPMGVDFKIAGNDIVQWNVGTTIQPTFVFGGKSYLLSSDKRNFIKETSLLNHFNLNAGFETFISYKLSGFTLQIGPEFRKQLFTTNSKTYTVQEKLTTYGIKFGITKIIK